MNKIKYLFLAGILSATFANAQKRRGNSETTHTKKETTTYSCPHFRNLKWGTLKDSLMLNGAFISFKKAGAKNDTAAWYIMDDDMTIGTVTCKNIYYYFNDAGRLNRVKLIFPKYSKGEMIYILSTKYNDPTDKPDLANGYQRVWNNIDEVRLVFTYFEDPVDICTVEFQSDFERDESKKINRAVDDF